MSNEQSQQPWTDETLQDLANEHSDALGGNAYAYHAFLLSHQIMRDAWQSDHDRLLAERDYADSAVLEMRNALTKTAQQRDALQAKLDAAEQRIAELEGQVQGLDKALAAVLDEDMGIESDGNNE